MVTSYNRAYLALCLWHFAQIRLWRTSDTLGTLYEIRRPALSTKTDLMRGYDVRKVFI